MTEIEKIIKQHVMHEEHEDYLLPLAKAIEQYVIKARIEILDKLPSQMSGNKINWTLVEILEWKAELKKGLR